MEQHPIPQDVTGFQFKLIGSMTVKQFGYVASGVILAVVCYYIKIDNFFWITAKIFLIPLFAGSGVIVAFVPIDGRSVDVMASNFAKALFSPNQYVYHRDGKKFSFNKINIAKQPVKTAAEAKASADAAIARKKDSQLGAKEAKLRAFLMSSQGGIRNDLDKREAAFLKTLTIPNASSLTRTVPAVRPAMPTPVAAAQMMQPRPIAASQPLQQPLPNPAPQPVVQPLVAIPQPIQQPTPVQPTVSAQEAALVQKEMQLSQELTKAQQEEATSQSAPLHDAAHQKVATLARQIVDIHTQKQQLEQELLQLKTQLATQKGAAPTIPAPIATTPTTQPITQDPQHVRTIPNNVTKNAGLPHVSDTPNVVVGIVKDPRGNVLPNILVEVKDKDSNPVRAFKTNPLGQFASATPLSAGTYTMELEDPKKQNRFDVIQVVANNQILPAMEVISHDAREDLRKQLFAS